MPLIIQKEVCFHNIKVNIQTPFNVTKIYIKNKAIDVYN